MFESSYCNSPVRPVCTRRLALFDRTVTTVTVQRPTVNPVFGDANFCNLGLQIYEIVSSSCSMEFVNSLRHKVHVRDMANPPTIGRHAPSESELSLQA